MLFCTLLNFAVADEVFPPVTQLCLIHKTVVFDT